MVLIALVGAAVVAIAITPVVARLAERLGIMDEPGPLKVQQRPIPYLGGLAVFAAAAPFMRNAVHLVLPLGAALSIGLADDAWDLPPRLRLVLHALVGVAAAAVVPTPIDLHVWLITGAVLGPLIINAVNLIDGLDGLAAGVVASGAAGFALVLDDSAQICAAAIVGGLVGFLVHNAAPARIYLGDAGSYSLGSALTVLLLLAFSAARNPAHLVAPFAFVVVPLGDLAIAIVRRWRANRPLFEGDRAHVYDQMVTRGASPTRAVALCVGAQVLLTATGVAAYGRNAVVAALLLATGAAVVAVPIVAKGFLSPSYSKGS